MRYDHDVKFIFKGSNVLRSYLKKFEDFIKDIELNELLKDAIYSDNRSDNDFSLIIDYKNLNEDKQKELLTYYSDLVKRKLQEVCDRISSPGGNLSIKRQVQNINDMSLEQLFNLYQTEYNKFINCHFDVNIFKTEFNLDDLNPLELNNRWNIFKTSFKNFLIGINSRQNVPNLIGLIIDDSKYYSTEFIRPNQIINKNNKTSRNIYFIDQDKNTRLPNYQTLEKILRKDYNIDNLNTEPNNGITHSKIETIVNMSPIYISDNRTLNFGEKGNSYIGSFNLIRSKYNISLILKDQNNNLIFVSLPGELIDISVPTAIDSSLKIFKQIKNNQGIELYTDIHIKNPRDSQDYFMAKSYTIDGLYYDVENILFKQNFYPWSDKKYAKRLPRLFMIFYLKIFNDFIIQKSEILNLQDDLFYIGYHILDIKDFLLKIKRNKITPNDAIKKLDEINLKFNNDFIKYFFNKTILDITKRALNDNNLFNKLEKYIETYQDLFDKYLKNKRIPIRQYLNEINKIKTDTRKFADEFYQGFHLGGYHQKYLKYKQKYLELKKKLNK